jgi:adenylate kinase
MNGRRVCPKCGTLYNAISRPPKIDGYCDLDGEKLVVREDDREEVVRERLAQYEAQTMPLIEYFRGAGARVFEVDASRDRPEVVFGRIQGMIETLVQVV